MFCPIESSLEGLSADGAVEELLVVSAGGRVARLGRFPLPAARDQRALPAETRMT